MTTLRVLLDALPAAGAGNLAASHVPGSAVELVADWALFDAADHVLNRGRGRPADWPVADAMDAVVAATHGRVVTLTLPPLPPARVAAAAAFALEDQLAGAPDDSHAGFGAQSADGTVRAVVIAAAWMQAFAAASSRFNLRWRRVLLESDLALPLPNAWRWCAVSFADPGFIRTDRGGTIATSPTTQDALPPELTLALKAAKPHQPRTVRVDVGGMSGSVGRSAQSDARTESGVDFVAGTPWQWTASPHEAFAAAIDLQVGRYDFEPVIERVSIARLLGPALWVVAVALAVQVFAGVGQWLVLQWQQHAVDREMTALARRAAPDAPQDLAATTVIARRDAVLRHSAGLPAADDLLPLLARATPALAALPPATVRSFHFADRHIVFELQHLTPEQSTRVQRALQNLGMTAVAAPTATGVRLRAGLD